MKRLEHYRWHLSSLFGLLLVLISGSVMGKTGEIYTGAKEQTFPLLQTKTGAYTNVTVTKKTKDWIFIIHAAGVCNVKATDLSTDMRIVLGYEEAPKLDASGKVVPPPEPAAQSLGKLVRNDLTQVKVFATDWRHNGKEKVAELRGYLTENPMVVTTVLGILAVVYVFSSICFWLICRKTHIAPGPLVWVPFLQLIPLLRAANLPRVWFFAYFLPLINIVALILLSIKLVKSRGKNPWVAFLLILPPTSFFAFLYLAFSRSAPVEIGRPEILALETA